MVAVRTGSDSTVSRIRPVTRSAAPILDRINVSKIDLAACYVKTKRS